MTWTKLSDGWNRHPKMLKLSRDARLFWVDALTHCNEQLTDGEISNEALYLIVGAGLTKNSVKTIVKSLENCGLFEQKSDGNSYIIHDFLEWNPSKSSVIEKRETTKKRVESFRSKRSCNAVTNAVVTHEELDQCNASPDPDPDPDQIKKEIPPTPQTGGASAEHSDSQETLTTFEPEPKRKRKPNRVPLPSDWKPKAGHIAKAKELRLDIAAEAQAFIENHGSKGNMFADWDLAFYTWLRNTTKYGPAVSPDASATPEYIEVPEDSGPIMSLAEALEFCPPEHRKPIQEFLGGIR